MKGRIDAMGDDDSVSFEERRRQEINEIGRAVKVARTGRGWSLRRLAEEAGVSASLLSAVETGKIVPTVGSLFAISDALERPAETFFPARRQLTGVRPVDTAELQPEPGEDRPLTESDAGRVVETVRREGDLDPQSITFQPSSGPVMTPPHLTLTGSLGNATPTLGRQVGAPRPTTRSITRPSRVVSRRVGPTSGRGETPVSPTPLEVLSPSPDQHHPDPAEATPTPSVRRGGVSGAGVAVRRVDERPSMLLEDGIAWTLPVEVVGVVGQVIDVSIPPGLGTPLRHRVRDRATTLLVTRGRLRIDAAFVETILETGDSIVISAGVPHRLTGDRQVLTAYLVFVSGNWDGTL